MGALAAVSGLGPLILVVLLLTLVIRRRFVRPELPQAPRSSGGDGSGTREPRRPRPTAGAGAVALAVPSSDRFRDVG